jgi:hypothetical protein
MQHHVLTLWDIIWSHSETSLIHIRRHHMGTFWHITWAHSDTSQAHIRRHHMLTFWDITRSFFGSTYAHIMKQRVLILRYHMFTLSDFITLWNIICSLYETSYAPLMLGKYAKHKLKRKSEETRCKTETSTQKNNYFFKTMTWC